MSDTSLILIAVVAKDGAIGRAGDLLWHLPGELKHFKSVTMGAPVIMGRKTWESLPKRPLPGRQNIVVSRNAAYDAPGATVADSLAKAVAVAEGEKAFVLGGGAIYREAMPLADILELTEVEATAPDADTFFPEVDKNLWPETAESLERPTIEEKGLKYRFATRVRRH